MFDASWGSMWHHSSEKNAPGNGFKKSSLQHGNQGLLSRGSQRATSRAHFSNKKQQLELNVLFELVSIAICWKKIIEMLFELASIAHGPSKCSKEMERINVKSRLPMIWHALGWGLANYLKIIEGTRAQSLVFHSCVRACSGLVVRGLQN